MPDGEFEVRNRHGDVVQRGEVEIADVGPGYVDMAFHDPPEIRRSGDQLSSIVAIPADVMREAFGE